MIMCVVQVYHMECYKEFGSTTGDHSKNTIHNLYASLEKLLMSNIYIYIYSKLVLKKGDPWQGSPITSL